MMKHVLLLACLGSVASAETYHLDKGAVVKHEHRCASPKATKRLDDFIAKRPAITVGLDQMTSTTVDPTTSSDADVVLEDADYRWGWWHLSENLTLIAFVHPRRDEWCRDAHQCRFRADIKISIIQRFDGAACYEQWSGVGEQR